MTNDVQEFSYTGPGPQGDRVINFNPIFPVLIAEVEMDLPTHLINEDALRLAGDQRNYEGGYSTFFNRPEIEKITHMNGLRQAIYSVAVRYAEEVDYELNIEKCSVDLWVNVMRKGGYHPPHNHPRSHFSGTFYSKVDDTCSPLILMNPTAAFRMHEPPLKQQSATPFAAESMTVQPKQGVLYLWPSWLYHGVPEMQSDSTRISFSFNIDFLPLGA